MDIFNGIKLILKIGFIIPVYWGMVAIVSTSLTLLVTSQSTGILNDLFALIQIWLPFNLNVILVWLGTSVTMYLTYAMAMLMLSLINIWAKS